MCDSGDHDVMLNPDPSFKKKIMTNIQPCSIISKQSIVGLQQEKGMQQHHQ